MVSMPRPPSDAHGPDDVATEITVVGAGRGGAPGRQTRPGTPNPRRPRRLVWAIGLLVAVLMIVFVTAAIRRSQRAQDEQAGATSTAATGQPAGSDRVSGTDSTPGESAETDPAAQPTSAHETPPPVTGSTTPSVAATDVLVPGGSYSANVIDTKSVDIASRMINISSNALALTGPIRLLGPDGTVMPHSDARIVAGGDYQAGGQPLPTALHSIAPHQQVVLVVTATIDCSRASVIRRWPEGYPTVELPLAGFASPWTRPLNDIFMMRPGPTLYARVCVGTGRVTG